MNEGSKNLLSLLVSLGLAFALGRTFKKDRSPKQLLEQEELSYLIRVILEWRPVSCNCEREYQISLQQYLLGRFSENRLRVDREWGMGKSRVDIVVERQFGIEMKYDLNSENEIKRLITQANEMNEEFRGSLILLCGNTSEDVYNRLKQELYLEDDSSEPIREVIRILSYEE